MMKATDVIRTAMQISDQGMLQLIEDMRDAPMTSPTARGGNHPLWVLGHIAFVEADVPHILFGESNPLEHWGPLFAAGSEPVTVAGDYPPLDDVLHAYREARARNLEILERLGEDGLDQPTVAPPSGLEDVLRTAGQTLLVIALHQMNHRGQVADARRAAGRTPLFTPGNNGSDGGDGGAGRSERAGAAQEAAL